MRDAARRRRRSSRRRRPGEPTYAEKLTVDEFELDPAAPAGGAAPARCAAGNPRPGAWIVVDGKRLKVWRAHVRGRSVRARRGAARRQARDAVRRVGRRPPRRGAVRDDRRNVTPREGRARRAGPGRGGRVRERPAARRCCARAAWSNGSGRRPPSSSTARCAGAARSTRCSSRCSIATSTTSTRRCAPRCGSASYQLVEGVAPHAAVGETVGAPGARAAREGVRRTRCCAGWPRSARRGRWPEGDSVTAVGVRTSMPDWIVARLFADLGVDDADGRARDRERARRR